jgi:hypothetical protein
MSGYVNQRAFISNIYVVLDNSLSLQCEFVSDIIQTAYPRLIPALSDAVCSCAGCCTESGSDDSYACLYDLLAEDKWLQSLLEI